MKKILFCSGLLALVASCTSELETDSLGQQTSKGITFTVVEDSGSRGQFGQSGNSFDSYWLAEKDQISVFSTLTNGNNSSLFVDGTGKTYKATVSEMRGQFTSVDNSNLLDFVGATASNPAQFFAVYPNTVNVIVTSANTTKAEFTLGNLPKISEQTQYNYKGRGIHNQRLLVSATTGHPEEDKEAVGENANLNFNGQVTTLLLFKTVGLNDYNDLFGNLKTITITTLGGYAKNSEGNWELVTEPTLATAASNLAYDNTDASIKATVNMNSITRAITGKTLEFISRGTTPSSSIKLNLNQKWSDEANAFVVALPVARNFTGDKAEHKEAYKIDYVFENINFSETNYTSNPWVIGAAHSLPQLKINDYPYLVVEKAGGETTLIINSGSLDEIVKNNSGTYEVTWPLHTTNKVNVANIENIISNVTTDASDYVALKKFTTLTGLTLNKDTEIPANAFNGTLLDNLDILKLPLVTTIDSNFTGGNNFSGLTTLEMNSYGFAQSNDINGRFFNTGTKSTLSVLNIAGVTDMVQPFKDITLTFKDYNLTEVTVKDGVNLSQNAFMNNTNLTKFTGNNINLSEYDATNAFNNAGITSISVGGDFVPASAFANSDLTTATVTLTQSSDAVIRKNAFYNCGSLTSVTLNNVVEVQESAFEEDASLASVTMNSVTSIGNKAFKENSNLTTVTFNPENLKSIGNYAFQECTNLTYFDLAKVTTLGKNAFESTNLKSNAANLTVLTVGATTIQTGAFKNTNVKLVKFTDATAIGADIFKYCSNLSQVYFNKVFGFIAEEVLYDTTFGPSSAEVTLYVDKANQPYVEGSVLSYPKAYDSDGVVTTWGNMSFKGIYDKAKWID